MGVADPLGLFRFVGIFGIAMQQISVRLAGALLGAIDKAALRLGRSRTDVVREAIERHLENLGDLSCAVKRLRDPGDPILDWECVRQELLDVGRPAAD